VFTELSLRQPAAPGSRYNWSAVLFLTHSGRSTLSQTALTDLTGRKQMEDSLRAARNDCTWPLRAPAPGLDLDLATGTANWSTDSVICLAGESPQPRPLRNAPRLLASGRPAAPNESCAWSGDEFNFRADPVLSTLKEPAG